MLTIKPDSSGTGIIWEELHNPVITNAFGLFTVVLGRGTRQGTSTVPAFSSINWAGSQLFIKTQVYYLSTWYNMGVTRLWTVPYAMATGNISGSVKKLQVSGTEANLDSALFEVKNKDGQIVFAVYNEGVRVYVDDGELGKGKKGGFAIGSFSKAKGYDDYFIVTRDSIRAYIDSSLVKAKKGGFAIGSFSKAKDTREEYFRVTRDSTRIYIDNSSAKALKGGFAIGSFSPAKANFAQYLSVNSLRTNVQVKDTIKGFSVTNIQGGGSVDFMRIDKINSFIGHETGLKTAPSTTGDQGKYNVFLGFQSGNNNTSGYRNVFMGYRAGMKNTSAENNVYIGTESGIQNQVGNSNTFIGYRSGYLTTTSENTFVGHGTGYYNQDGRYNTFLGKGAGSFHTTGDYSTFLGWGAGNSNAGSKNVFIGAGAGTNNAGNSNILIGYNADISGSNKLWINNGFSATPLISGDFSARKVVINGKAGDFSDPGYEFYVVGDAAGSTPWASPSDIRLKTNISEIPFALEKVCNLRGVYFEWKPGAGMDAGRNVGLIAQELETQLPEVVRSGGDYLSVQYGPVSALLVQAIKEQQVIINNQNRKIEELSTQIERLKSSVDEINAMVNELKTNGNK
jgi:hypothetical protein